MTLKTNFLYLKCFGFIKTKMISKESQRVRKSKKVKKDPVFNAEEMLPISEVLQDTIILKDWGLRAIIRVDGLNLDLRNYDEQQIVVEHYKKFLNWLSFPIQIWIRSNYLDLTDYIKYLKDHIAKIENDVLKFQAEQYTYFIERLNEQKGMIYVKEFYVIVPFYSGEKDMENIRKPFWAKILEMLEPKDTPEKIISRRREFFKSKSQLDMRVNLIQSWLRELGMTSQRLTTKDLLWLLFEFYNPLSHKSQTRLGEEEEKVV